MNQKIVRRDEVEELTGLSISTLSRLEKVGQFPRRRRIGKCAVGWLESEIVDWMDGILNQKVNWSQK
jgi:prophage regulatory protein